MDPITVTTTFMTLGTFVKDLIEVGESIHRSIEKVGENRRQIRELTEEVVRTLYDLANLTRGREETFQGSELLSALENLKAEMLHVHSKCLKITPIQLPGLRGIGSQLKAWRKRDDLEGKIGRLKERVNKCYRQFTAFSAARIEQTTLRIEQTLIVANVENQVKARRLEGMMAQLLLETEFGQNKMIQTIEIIEADPTHESLESRYLSAQTMCLIDSVQRLLTGGKLVLHEPLWDPTQPFRLVFSDSRSTLHVLHWILGTAIEIKESPAACMLLSGPIEDAFRNLGVHLSDIGMVSESIAWERLKIQVLLSLDCAAAISPDIAHAFKLLSFGYHRQSQFQRALQASQQSFDLWHHICESLPDVDNRIGPLTSLNMHAQNLLETGQKMTALSTAQDAAAISRPMAEQLINSSSGLLSLNDEAKCEAVQCRDSLFILAKALASLNRHLEAYEAFKAGFQTFLSLPICECPPSGKDIDSFINEICKVSEGGGFSLAMLADCVILFHNLTRICLETTSAQFLWLFHAYAYFSQQDNSPGANHFMENVRIFLEPNVDRPPPELDISNRFPIDLIAHRELIEDAIRAFCTCPPAPPVALIRNIFVAHCERAVVVLREVAEKSAPGTLAWVFVLYTIHTVVPFVTGSDQAALLEVSTQTIEHSSTVLTIWGSNGRWFLDSILTGIFRYLWRAGFLDSALKVCEQIIKYLESRLGADSTAVVAELCWFRTNKQFILCDMGRLQDAVAEIRQTNMIVSYPGEFYLHPYIIHARILQQIGRNLEALQILKTGMADGSWKYCSGDDKVFDIISYFLLAELAAGWGHVGRQEKAVKAAERAVTASRRAIGDQDTEEHKCVLLHSLVTLSNCQTAVGRNDEALKVAHEAVSIYTDNASHMWEDFLYTIRREELGANAFQALSQRLDTSGELDQALINAEKATELFRQLIVLSPRHLPTLASSLRNQASILWKIGRREKAVGACIEAVDIMRKAVDLEAYFHPALVAALDHLAGYLTEKGNLHEASAMTAECAEVRGAFTSLRPLPELPFDRVDIIETDSDEEDEEDAEAWETASEADVECQDCIDSEAVTASPVTSQVQENRRAEEFNDGRTSESKKGEHNCALTSIPLKAKIKVDPLWILVGILSVLVGILSMALAVIWSRMP
ncbi:Tetratricopeptide repeat family [Mycena venus]|uniref:Tetratricopeptide repeat family n=1 Tax=Mycena venus TaxID=2733690 RepID=A0A8H7D0Y5_9AGAR|nr:Tetratricopeptide repeat family [Mycena venus]